MRRLGKMRCESDFEIYPDPVLHRFLMEKYVITINYNKKDYFEIVGQFRYEITQHSSCHAIELYFSIKTNIYVKIVVLMCSYAHVVCAQLCALARQPGQTATKEGRQGSRLITDLPVVPTKNLNRTLPGL